MTADSRLRSGPELYCIEVRTSRWEEQVAWYRQVLGLRSLFRVLDDRYALLAAGGTRLAIMESPEPGPACSRVSVAIEVGDLREVAARLRAAATPMEGPRQNAEGYDEITTQDPDGNRIRLFSWPLQGR